MQKIRTIKMVIYQLLDLNAGKVMKKNLTHFVNNRALPRLMKESNTANNSLDFNKI